MNLFANLEIRLKAHLASMVADGRLPDGLPIDRITVEPPRAASHGEAGERDEREIELGHLFQST